MLLSGTFTPAALVECIVGRIVIVALEGCQRANQKMKTGRLQC